MILLLLFLIFIHQFIVFCKESEIKFKVIAVTENGKLYSYEEENFENDAEIFFEEHILKDDFVLDFDTDSHGNLLICSKKGLFRFNKFENGTIRKELIVGEGEIVDQSTLTFRFNCSILMEKIRENTLPEEGGEERRSEEETSDGGFVFFGGTYPHYYYFKTPENSFDNLKKDVLEAHLMKNDYYPVGGSKSSHIGRVIDLVYSQKREIFLLLTNCGVIEMDNVFTPKRNLLSTTTECKETFTKVGFDEDNMYVLKNNDYMIRKTYHDNQYGQKIFGRNLQCTTFRFFSTGKLFCYSRITNMVHVFNGDLTVKKSYPIEIKNITKFKVVFSEDEFETLQSVEFSGYPFLNMETSVGNFTFLLICVLLCCLYFLIFWIIAGIVFAIKKYKKKKSDENEYNNLGLNALDNDLSGKFKGKKRKRKGKKEDDDAINMQGEDFKFV